MVIDRKRDIDTYLSYAESNGFKRTHVPETHIHGDYASGATALAAATGAGQDLSNWAAWVVPCDRPILLAADEGTDIEAARRALVRVGLDDISRLSKERHARLD